MAVWMITGSARGLGRAITEAALEAGHSVVAAARDPARLGALEAEYGARFRAFELDVTDHAQSLRAADFAVEAFGRIDVVVNNAGYAHLAPFEQAPAEDFRRQVETNFFGVVNLARAVLPVMRRQRSGHIINISSVGGRLGSPGLSAYQSAKWAVGGFTEVLSQEVAPFGVKVIAVEPGGMRTDWAFIAGEAPPPIDPDYAASVGVMSEGLKGYAGNEVGDPAKIAKVVLDLATRDSLPAHLLLGSDALFVFEKAEAARQEAAEAWADVSRSTDFDGVDPSAIGRMIGGSHG